MLIILDKEGINNYCQMLIESNKKYLYSHNDRLDLNMLRKEIEIGNENNALTESILEYNLFDVIKYYIDAEFGSTSTKSVLHLKKASK